MTHKEINKIMSSLLGEPLTYDLRREFRVIHCELAFEEAMELFNNLPEEEQFLYSVTTTIPDDYCSNVDLALYAARRIAERNQQTFVLSLEDGTWKAAYGDWGNCAEYSGSNPAYVICVCILKFMGKL